MALSFKKATKKQARLRLAFDGPAGAGKTYSSLRVASALVPGGRIAVIDTERGSASKYARSTRFPHLFDFDVLELDRYAPDTYVEAIKAAARERYDVIIVDSLSHAWNGTGGALEIVDTHRDKFGSGWRSVTPMHNALVDALLTSPAHVLVTMRTKMEYVLEEVERNGKKIQQPKKVGMKPIQREGMEYEFDVVGDLDIDNNLVISKTRCSDLTGRVFHKPGEDFADILRAWLDDGDPIPIEAEAHDAPAPRQPDPRPAAHAPTNEASRQSNGHAGDLWSTLAAQCEMALNVATSDGEIDALSAEWSPKFRGAPNDVRGRVKGIFDASRARAKANAAAALADMQQDATAAE